jgi:hypothetical protein
MTRPGYDVTFPLVKLTGHERSFGELAQPDKRMLGYMGVTVESLQAPYITVAARLPSATPQKLRDRIVVTRELAVYGYFVWEFHAVSMFWAVSCIEMALDLKFAQSCANPVEITKARDGSEQTRPVPFVKLKDYLRRGWHIPKMKYFDYSFRALLEWAFRKKILPEDIPIPVPEIINSFNNRFMLEFATRAEKDGLLKSPANIGEICDCWNKLPRQKRQHFQPKNSTVLIDGLPQLRNEMAHPNFNLTVFPRAPVGTFELLVDIVARLWG